MIKHPHAELMLEYAKDATGTDKPWELTVHLLWTNSFVGQTTSIY